MTYSDVNILLISVSIILKSRILEYEIDRYFYNYQDVKEVTFRVIFPNNLDVFVKRNSVYLFIK